MKRSITTYAFAVVSLVAIIGGASAADSPAEYRDFEGKNGKIVKAAIFEKNDEEVILLLPNGQKATVPLENLSEDDQEYIGKWSKEKSVFLEQCRSLTVRELLELRGYESFTYRLENNSIIVDGKLNGHDAKFMIDTGAHSTVLHVQSAEKMQCEVGPMDQKIYGIGGEAPAALTKVGEIRLGESVIKDQVLLSADLMKDLPAGARKSSDAIFGAEFLSQLHAVISYKEGRMFLRPDLADGNEAPEEDPEFRFFKFAEGGEPFKATIVEKKRGEVILANDEGNERRFRTNVFTDEDQKYIEDWTEAKGAFMKYCQELTVEELLELREYESFEYERKGNHIFVDGFLNETETTFMIDTGAQTSVLHLENAKDSDCKVTDQQVEIFGVGGKAIGYVTNVKLIKMGTAEIANRKLISADLFKNQPGARHFGAIFGADFLRELEGVVTYREERIFLRQD